MKLYEKNIFNKRKIIKKSQLSYTKNENDVTSIL